ncbi:MAG: hypothetical protein MUF54_10965 [Polyangiaceae bacterium]|nr:hypothetical protein [Polyangiaceae bacterium]
MTFVLWLSALRLSENTASVGNLIFVSPLVSLGLINWLVGERILPSTCAGLVLILTGLVVQRSAGRRAPERAAVAPDATQCQ